MSSVKITDHIGGKIVQPKGKFVGGKETDELNDTLKKLATDDKAKKVIIDLNSTTYLNSTALGVLISAHTTFSKNDGKIALCNVSKAIENLFVITKLTLVFPIFENLEEAVNKF